MDLHSNHPKYDSVSAEPTVLKKKNGSGNRLSSIGISPTYWDKAGRGFYRCCHTDLHASRTDSYETLAHDGGGYLSLVVISSCLGFCG